MHIKILGVLILFYIIMPISVFAQEKTDALDWLKMKSPDWCKAQQKMSFKQFSEPPMHFDFQFTIEKGMQTCHLIINETTQMQNSMMASKSICKKKLVLPDLNPDIVVGPADRLWDQYLGELQPIRKSNNESRMEVNTQTYHWINNPWAMIIYASSKETPIESERTILATGKKITERLNCAMIFADNEAHARQIALVMKRLILGCQSGEYDSKTKNADAYQIRMAEKMSESTVEMPSPVNEGQLIVPEEDQPTDQQEGQPIAPEEDQPTDQQEGQLIAPEEDQPTKPETVKKRGRTFHVVD